MQDVVVSSCQSFFWFAARVGSFCRKQVDDCRIDKDYDAADSAVALPTSLSLLRRSAAGTRVAIVVCFFREGGGCPRQKEGQD
jgi:hypothetical protein